MKGYYVLNGISQIKNNKAIILTGISGVRKSAVGTALSMKG